MQGLIQTGTSLISGLLGGNKNFGLVLGQYVGTALDGLSGGGGAVGSSNLFSWISSHFTCIYYFFQINNGQFIGNFLGTVLAALSAVFIYFAYIYIYLLDPNLITVLLTPERHLFSECNKQHSTIFNRIPRRRAHRNHWPSPRTWSPASWRQSFDQFQRTAQRSDTEVRSCHARERRRRAVDGQLRRQITLILEDLWSKWPPIWWAMPLDWFWMPVWEPLEELRVQPRIFSPAAAWVIMPSRQITIDLGTPTIMSHSSQLSHHIIIVTLIVCVKPIFFLLVRNRNK